MGSIVLCAFALVGGLAFAPSAAAIPALPTTTSITLPSVTFPPTTLPSTTLPISTSTTVTVPTSSTTTVTPSTSEGVTSTTVVETTTTQSSTLSEMTLVVPAVDGEMPSHSTVDLSSQSTPSKTSDRLPLGADGGGAANDLNGRRTTTNQVWAFLFDMLRPVLPPQVASVLLSPLLVLEVVIRALVESGTAMAWPIGALGVSAAWAYWRWIPLAEYSNSPTDGGFLDGWQGLSRGSGENETSLASLNEL